ncbi:hypothetical protein GCM10011575_10690 [Microlunatus endophyticus]|uniref:CDP-Glycerol:Poly(Glycerophosphate) glycerophosphotransferase n=1 Tax=Microlunatus endophyticus TaxID=1716077 RepID=A0A917S2J1_9ACTN|nr:CDP-glycerol glycerophosphotransferase family protein [Microlunatus endophyticus]GGL54145.1 hypothetical protein GCM10011575_10690 [Microlunatus endophyticus]
MNLRSVLKSALGQLPIAVAIGLALVVIAQLREHGVLGLLAAIGTAVAVAALPLISAVHGPKPPEALRLPGYRRPLPVPTGRGSQGIAGVIVLIVVVVMWRLPGWVAFIVMVLAGLGLLINIAMAYNRRRARSRLRAAVRTAVEAYGPRFVIYTGRRNDASYQLTMWIPIVERLGLRYLIVLRHQDAVRPTRMITDAPIIMLPTGSDLDAIMVPGLRIAFYVNGIAENSTLVNYRNLTHVYLGHGDSDKELSVHPMHAMFDRVFVAGQAAIDRYSQAGVIIPENKFMIVGRPQMADLDKAVRPIGEIQPPRVLFAPTWRGYNAQTTLSSLPVGASIVRALLDRGAVVGFRAHPFSWLGAGERSEITAIDEILRKDREATGRPHRLAVEHRDESVADAFDNSDALITDIGSVLVDYFATGKPYAVVLPPGQPEDTARADLPSTRAAYLIRYEALGDPLLTAQLLEQLLQTDPLARERATTARYYLGDHPGDDQPFYAAVHSLL